MRILFSSNGAWTCTGYGNQTALFLPRIKALGHELAGFFWYGLEGGVLSFDGIQIFPKAKDGFGNDIVGAHARQFKADIVITLIDAWVLRADAIPPPIKWCPWLPIDMDPIPPPVLNAVKDAFVPIVYSQFAVRKANEAGLDVRYVPHGVDTLAFAPMDKRDARRTLNWPDDRFIFGMVAANKGTPSRKCLPQQLEAFARFTQRHPDSLLYLHTNKSENGEMGGVNLPELCRFLGIEDKVLFCDQYHQLLGFSTEHMATLYNGMDVLLNVSMGEGFGIPILEAQACGTPVITGDWTSMSELNFGGWLVERKDADPWWTPLASYQFIPRIGAIERAMNTAYADIHEGHRVSAREGAMLYDANVVTEVYWKATLEEIEARMGLRRRSVPVSTIEEVLWHA